MKSAVSAPGEVRFEAAHCAAHLATNSAPGCSLSAIRRGADRLALDRLNASMKAIAFTRPQRLAIVEADALPATAHVQPPLVLTQRPLRMRSASEASAAR